MLLPIGYFGKSLLSALLHLPHRQYTINTCCPVVPKFRLQVADLEVAHPVPLQDGVIPAPLLLAECDCADGVLWIIRIPFDLFADDSPQMITAGEKPVELQTAYAFDRHNLLQQQRAKVGGADQLPFGGFALLGFGWLKLSDSANWQRHQFVFGLQPIVQVMPRLAAMLKKYFMGSATDLFLGGTIELHTPFLLLPCWVLEELAHPACSPLSDRYNISLIRKKPNCFRKYLCRPDPPHGPNRQSLLANPACRKLPATKPTPSQQLSVPNQLGTETPR